MPLAPLALKLHTRVVGSWQRVYASVVCELLVFRAPDESLLSQLVIYFSVTCISCHLQAAVDLGEGSSAMQEGSGADSLERWATYCFSKVVGWVLG